MTHAHRPVRQAVATGASLLMGGGLLWWLLRAVDWVALLTQALAIGAGPWLVMASGLMVSHVLRAGRIRNEWQSTLLMDWRSAWALLVTHSAWVVLAPLRLGESAYIWALHQRGGIGIARAAGSLLKLRLQDAGVLACTALVIWLPVPTVLRGALALAMLGAQVWLAPLVWQRLMRRRDPQADMPTGTRAISRASWFYAIANWLVKLAAIGWPLSHLVGLSPFHAFAAALGGEWGAALPLQPPAGLGPYEAGVWAGAQLVAHAEGMAAPTAPELAGAALVVHMVALILTVGCALFAHLSGWTQRPLRPAA